MAGVYADIPGTRFALDQDGTVMKWRNFTTLSTWTDITASIAESQKVNTANYVTTTTTANASNTVLQFAIAFPEARNLNGIYFHPGFGLTIPSLSVVWEYSTDTTDGTDGTWSTVTITFTNLSNHYTNADNDRPYYRSDIATLSLTSVKGIRVRWISNSNQVTDWRLFVLHIYGVRSGANHVAFWDPSVDQALAPAYLDFGDIAQGTTVTRQFRIKNTAGQTANGITVAVSDLLSEFGGNLQLSTDNTTYTSSINIGNLTAGAVSGTLYVRRTVPAAETPTQHSLRLLANATSWT